jgi:hypothetical protein
MGSIEAVDLHGQGVTRRQIGRLGRANAAARQLALRRPPLQTAQRFADIEAEAGIEGEGAIVERSLDETNARCAALESAIHDRLHEFAADAMVLNSRIDGDGADAGDDRALIETVAAHDAAVDLRHDAVKAGMAEHEIHDAESNFRTRKVAGKIMFGVDGGECAVADSAAGSGVRERSLADGDVRHSDSPGEQEKYTEADAAERF